jgi:putative tricarboxylic transport membrane protein
LLTRDRTAALVLFALAAGAYWAGSSYPSGTLAQPGPGFVPRLLAALLIVAAIALFIGGKAARLPDIGFADLPIMLIIVLLLGAATLALERAGYRATVFLFLLVFIAAVERRPLWLAILLSGGFAAGSFYVINTLLRVPLPLSRWGW